MKNIGGAMDKPLASIIVPVYNAEKHLEQTIQSVIDQTWPNKQLILVNDGSTDESLAIATKYANDWIIVIDQPNGGASKSRNVGLKAAKGKYIQFLDADDLLSPDKIEQQVNLLEKNSDKIAVCSTIHFPDRQNHLQFKPTDYEEQFLINSEPANFLINLMGGFSENGSMVTIHAWLTPKRIIDEAGPWNESLTVDDDGEFFTRIILKSKGVIKTDGISYYRKYISPKSLSASKNNTGFTSRLNAVLLKKKWLLAVNNSFEAKAAIYKALTLLAADCYLTYPDIYKKAISELPAIRLKYNPPMGGIISNTLANIFGWRATKFIKRFF